MHVIAALVCIAHFPTLRISRGAGRKTSLQKSAALQTKSPEFPFLAFTEKDKKTRSRCLPCNFIPNHNFFRSPNPNSAVYYLQIGLIIFLTHPSRHAARIRCVTSCWLSFRHPGSVPRDGSATKESVLSPWKRFK